MGEFGIRQSDFDRATRMMKLDSPEYKAVEAEYKKAIQDYEKAEFVKAEAARTIMKLIQPTSRLRVSHLQVLSAEKLYHLLCAVQILHEQMGKCGFVRHDTTRHNSTSF